MFFFKQKTAYEVRISDWSSDVCSSDLAPARRWLADNELADPDDPTLLVIRRVVYAEGRTRAFVNGSPVNAGQLRELGEMLIEVFGQSESQTLLRVDEIGRASCRERVCQYV